MLDNYFDRFAKRHAESRDSATKANDLIRQKLLDFSINPKGNDLSEFFEAKDVAVCKEFLTSMKKRQYPKAHQLKLRSLKSKRVLTQNELALGPWSHSRIEKLRNQYRWTKLWDGKGYFIGVIKKDSKLFNSSSGSSSVYLCTDKRLRCERSKPVFRDGTSVAYGYGTIPDKSLMNDLKLSIGHFIGGSSSEIRTFQEHSLKSMLEDHTVKAL